MEGILKQINNMRIVTNALHLLIPAICTVQLKVNKTKTEIFLTQKWKSAVKGKEAFMLPDRQNIWRKILSAAPKALFFVIPFVSLIRKFQYLSWQLDNPAAAHSRSVFDEKFKSNGVSNEQYYHFGECGLFKLGWI